MKMRDHADPVTAMRAARVGGYVPRFRHDGKQVWTDGKRDIALHKEQRLRSCRWHWTREVPDDLKGVTQ